VPAGSTTPLEIRRTRPGGSRLGGVWLAHLAIPMTTDTHDITVDVTRDATVLTVIEIS
jgi:hypothetical protein